MSSGSIKTAKPQTSPSSNSRLARWAAGLLLLLAALSCLAAPLLALQQARQPFPGFLLEPSMVISALSRADWAGSQQGLGHPWRVIAADDRPLSRPAELNAYLQEQPLGSPIHYTVENPQGQRQNWPEALPSRLLNGTDLLLLFWGPYLVALAYLACAFWVYRARGDSAPGQACSTCCAGTSMGLALLYNSLSGHHVTHLWTAALALSAAGGLHLALVFPETLFTRDRARPWGILPYLAAAGLILWTETSYAWGDSPWGYQRAWRWMLAGLSLSALLLVGRLLYSRYFSRNSRIRQQARSVLLGTMLAFLPTGLILGATVLGFELNLFHLSLLLLALPVFPLTLAYAIARGYVLDIDRVISRGLAYSLLILLLIGVYMAMVALIGWWAPGLLRTDDPLALGGLILLAALLVGPLQQSLRRFVDRLLYRERLNFRRVVREFGQSLSQVIDLPELSQLVLQRICETLHLDAVSLYLFDQRSGTYQLYQAMGPAIERTEGRSTPAFVETDRFIQHLRAANGAIYRHHRQGQWLHELPVEEKQRLNNLHGLVFLPLITQSRLVGWLNLGARLSGEMYSAEDLELLNALADRASVAIENARLFAERERRLTELAVLNEIGQAINSALSPEQVLQTIYEQTGRLMDTTHFSLALHEPEQEEVSFLLYVQDGQVRTPWSRRQGNGLNEYILRTRQPLLIAERVQETIQSLELDVIGRPASSWLGVPIIAEDLAIGVIAVQSTGPETTYDVQDLESLCAIANQAAIAITNARLYEMTDRALSRRREELTILDDFARSVSSTILDPHQVAEETLFRAIESLQASRGILIRYEQEGGPFPTLARLRWPAQGNWPALWQDALREFRRGQRGPWVRDLSDPTDPTQGPKVSPLHVLCPLVREHTPLALLHLALDDEKPLDAESLRFLRHLCDHASIALENALLYQQQVQQRQDAQRRSGQWTEILRLGQSLQVNTPLQTAAQQILQSACQTLACPLGRLWLVEEQDPSLLRCAAAAGATKEDRLRLQSRPVPLKRLERLLRPESLLGQSSYLVAATDEKAPGELECQKQAPAEPGLPWPPSTESLYAILTPLRGAKKQLLGLLSLHQPLGQPVPSGEQVEILEILVHQGAMAIENTRLYQALHEANEAKSEFLSLIAQELQVPKRSIWSYAELLRQLPTGQDPVTQQGFLRLLQSNLGRLDTLIAKLLEISHIEAGRLELSLAPLHLDEVVQESVAAMRPHIEHKGLTLHLDLPADLPPVRADGQRLVQVCSNLLSNACKYTAEPGEIRVSAHLLQRPDELNGSGPEPNHLHCPCLCLSIQDSGIGLTPQEKKQVFGRLFRSEHPLVRQEPGTGLGLYLAQLLVEAHQGQIWVESKTGQGSTFHIALPLDRPKQNEGDPETGGWPHIQKTSESSAHSYE
ncbi:MAG: GAF domain-containing protein [Chloroflexia bacterium]|nr:GAF domain-containing protein [Chloroflexia bacterium]